MATPKTKKNTSDLATKRQKSDQAQRDGLLEPVQVSNASSSTSDGWPMPGMEVGGLSGALQARRADAERRRVEAMERWKNALQETDDASMAIAQRLRPEDTSQERQNLRNLAAAQSLGELLGSMFGGIRAFGKRGAGYVPQAPGLAGNALRRMDALRQRDIIANRDYRNFMTSLLARKASSNAQMAQQEYRGADEELRRVQAMSDYGTKQDIASRHKAVQAARTQQERMDMERQRQANRIGLKSHVEKLRDERAEDRGDVDQVKMLLLPKDKTTKRETETGTIRTTAPYTAYSKQQDAAVEALARQIVPVRKRHNLSDEDIRLLNGAISSAPDLGANWNQIDAALSRGASVDDIIFYIERNKWR